MSIRKTAWFGAGKFEGTVDHGETKSWRVESVQPGAQVPRRRSVPGMLARRLAQEDKKAAIRLNHADVNKLGRFLEAPESDYDRALAEIRSGRKRTHWMWYIFLYVN